MSGRLVILPKKSYCPWNPKNVARVERDEARHDGRRQPLEPQGVALVGEEKKPFYLQLPTRSAADSGTGQQEELDASRKLKQDPLPNKKKHTKSTKKKKQQTSKTSSIRELRERRLARERQAERQKKKRR